MKVIRAEGWKVVYVILGDLGIAALWLRPRDWSFQFKIYPVCIYIDIGPLQIGIMRRKKKGVSMKELVQRPEEKDRKSGSK